MLLFDLDGTLVDDRAATRKAVDTLSCEYSDTLATDEQELFAEWSVLLATYFQQYLDGRLSMQDQRRHRVKELFGRRNVVLSETEADEVFATYERAYERAWRCFDDVAEALSTLQGQRLAILTNGEAGQQRRKLAATSIGHLFEAVVTSSELGVAKPHADAFHRACEKLGVLPSECWYIGDNLEVDAAASVRAGLRGVWLNREGLIQVDPLPPGVQELVSLMDLPTLLCTRGAV